MIWQVIDVNAGQLVITDKDEPDAVERVAGSLQGSDCFVEGRPCLRVCAARASLPVDPEWGLGPLAIAQCPFPANPAIDLLKGGREIALDPRPRNVTGFGGTVAMTYASATALTDRKGVSISVRPTPLAMRLAHSLAATPYGRTRK